MKKNVLLIYGKGTDELLNRQSALGSYIFCLLELLHRQDCQIDVNGTAFEELAKKTASVPPQAIGTSVIRKLIPGFVKEIRRDKMIFAGHAGILSQVDPNKKYDLVLEFYTYGSRLGITLSEKYHCPLVTVFDSPVLEEYEFFHGKKSVGGKKIKQNQDDSLKVSAQVVVYSNAVKKYVAKITRREDNISIHQNVDFTRFNFLEPHSPAQVINIGFIGSFLKWHRVDLLVKVFEKLRAENLPVHLWLVGGGMEFPSIKEQVEKSADRKDITLTGFCDGEKLLGIKKQLHIGVMPGSNWYGAPNKIFEYGAAGLAVIAPDTPTIADLFTNEKELLLFEWDNEESAYAALHRLCTEPLLMKQLQSGLQQKIRETYSAENTTAFYLGLFNHALTGK